MSFHDYFLVVSVVLPIFFFGHLLNRGRLTGYGFEIACVMALGIVTWSMLSAHGYFGVVHYVLH